MVRVSFGKRLSTSFVFFVVLLALAALLAACAAPSGAGTSGGQAAAPQAAAPTTQAAPAATTAPAANSAPEATKEPAAAAPATAAPAAPVATDAPAQAPAAAAVSFSKDVMPVFQASCVKCHGGSDGTKGGLSLKTFDGLMAGGKDGPVIAPGNAASSVLVRSIQQGKMPKRGQKLPQDQIDLIAKWVAAGAQNN
jgi:mono/diheme cytochrome c family protein